MSEDSKVSLEELVRKHRARLLMTAFGLTRDRDEAEDLVQRALERALQHPSPPAGDESAFEAWITGILRNLFFDDWRAKQRRPRLSVLDVDTDVDIPAPVPEELPSWSRVTPEQLAKAIEQLPARLRTPYALHAQGRSYREIAAELDISRNSVGTRLRRARRELRVSLLALAATQGLPIAADSPTLQRLKEQPAPSSPSFSFEISAVVAISGPTPTPEDLERLHSLVVRLCDRLGLELSDDPPAIIGSLLKKFGFRPKRSLTLAEIKRRVRAVVHDLVTHDLDPPREPALSHARSIEAILNAVTGDGTPQRVVFLLDRLLVVKLTTPAGRSTVLCRELNDQDLEALRNRPALFEQPELLVDELCRMLGDQPAPPSQEPRAQKTILFLSANPTAFSRIGLDREAREIEGAIQRASHRDSLTFVTRWAVRPGDLIQALNALSPVAVHFSGHGLGTPGIVLQDDKDAEVLVRAEALRQLFLALNDRIELIVLNACFSEEQARAIVGVIDCVVGIAGSIEDQAARAFTATFYGALASGRSIRNAFDLGMAALAMNDQTECTDGPVLLAADAVDPDAMFLVERAETA